MAEVAATEAVVAHGLLNAVRAVGIVPALLASADDEDVERLCSMLSDQLALLVMSVDDLGDRVTDCFREDLHCANLAGDRVVETCRTAQLADMPDVVHILDDAARRIARHLNTIVQDMPSDVVLYLDTLDTSRV